MKPFITMAVVAVALFSLVTYPALAAVGTNPASGNPYDYSGAGDWLGSAGDDQFTNNAGATVNGDVDMTQGGADTFINNGTVTGDYKGASSNGNRITNSGVITNIEGSLNGLNYSSGGSNTIYNHGTTFSIYGSDNSGDYSSGGSNTIYNNNTVTFAIYGSYNSGDNSSGGSNTIYNHGTTFAIYGSYNSGDYSSGGSNRIYNYGIAEQIFGEVTNGFNSSGGTTVIYNYSTVTGDIYGASNASATGGGSRTIYNYGTVGDDIYGNYNRSANATGGSNTIYNYGTVGNSGPGDNNIYGSHNREPNTSGGDNTIYNYGSVQDNIYGSLNEGDNSSGGGNTITNSGTVGGSIYGTLNSGAGASSGGAGNTITNSGTVGGGIYAGDADDTVYILSGSNVSGVVDGQAGTDTLYFGLSGVVDSSALSSGSYLNFENVGLHIDGSTTLTGNWNLNMGVTVTSTGTLTLNSTLSGTTLNNAGTATFNGDTTFSGAVTNSGGLTVGSGSSLTASSVNNSDSLAVDGTLTADSLTNSGGMAIGGSVDVGTLNNDGGGLGVAGSLTADNLINSGGVGIGGTVTVGSLVNSGAIGVGTTLTAGSVSNSGNLAVGGTMAAGSVNNSGNLAVGGTMTADSIYNSGDLPVGGTLTAGSVTNSGFLPVGGTMNAGSVSNSGTFDVNGSVSTGSLSNSGDLDVTVGGTLVAGSLSNSGNAGITGSAIVSGATTNSGSLNVNGTLTTASLDNSGTIGGSGTIHSNITNTGVISPGNSIGTLHINGSLTFASGSSVAIELASDCSCDVVAVSGAVTINGGTISTDLPQALYTDGTSWQIITANGGITGMFDDISGQPDSAVLSFSQYNSGDTLSLVLNRKSYGDFASGGAADTGRGLDALVPMADSDMAMLLTAMDFNLTAGQIAGVLDALNPEMYTAFSAASLKAGGLFDGAMDRRLEELRQRRAYSLDQRQALSGLVQVASAETVPLGSVEQNTSSGWSLWGRGIGLWADQDAADGYLGRGQTTGGAALGADYVLGDWLALGLATGATRTDVSWSRGNYGGDIDAVHTGLYAQAGYEGFFARLLASYARLQNSATRPVNLEGYNVTARSDFDADLYAAGMALGYQVRYEAWLFEPRASLDYQHLAEDGFSEGGAGFLDLDVADRDTDSLLFNLGIRATRLIQADGWEMLPRLGIAWQHQLGDDNPSLDASFAGYGSAPFTVNGADFISDAAVAELGLTASMKSGLELFIDYRLAFADDYLAQVLGAGVTYSF